MSQWIIEIDTPEDEALLMQLLPKLNSRIVSQLVPKAKIPDSPIDILKRMAARGGTNSFGDAFEWQRETRQDRPLANRDE